MTTKQDVEAALRAFADQKAVKANERQTEIRRLQTDLRDQFQTLNRWVYNIPGLDTEEIAAAERLNVDGDQVVWSALLLKFAGTSISFQPTVKFAQVHLAIEELDGEKGIFLLKPNDHQFEVLNETGQRRLRYLTEADLLEEIISKTKAQPIR